MGLTTNGWGFTTPRAAASSVVPSDAADGNSYADTDSYLYTTSANGHAYACAATTYACAATAYGYTQALS